MNELSTLTKIDLIVQEAVKEDNPDIVFAELRRLEEAEKLMGMAKAKFIFTLHQNWERFTLSASQTMEDTAFEQLGWRKYTIDRYISMWKYKDAIPTSFKLEDRPVREVTPITNALSQGIEFTEENWEDLSRTTKQEEVYAVLREIKGEEPRKGSLQVYLYDDGSIVAWHQNIRYEVGYLDVKNTEEAIQKAIKRLTSGGGVILG